MSTNESLGLGRHIIRDVVLETDKWRSIIIARIAGLPQAWQNPVDRSANTVLAVCRLLQNPA